MAKKAGTEPTAKTPRRKVAEKEYSLGGASVPASLVSNGGCPQGPAREDARPTRLKSSSLLDTRVIYCGDNLDQLKKLPDASDSAFRTLECADMSALSKRRHVAALYSASGVMDAMMGLLGKGTTEASKLQTIRSRVRRHDNASSPTPTPPVTTSTPPAK